MLCNLHSYIGSCGLTMEALDHTHVFLIAHINQYALFPPGIQHQRAIFVHVTLRIS